MNKGYFKGSSKVYTHDEAAKIVELFESMLGDLGIVVPNPEDDEKEADNEAALYGSVYSELLDNVEDALIDLLERHNDSCEVIKNEFSGTW